jgi:hypothetical protein
MISVLSGEAFEAIRAEIIALVVFSINFPCIFVWEKIVASLEKV